MFIALSVCWFKRNESNSTLFFLRVIFELLAASTIMLRNAVAVSLMTLLVCVVS